MGHLLILSVGLIFALFLINAIFNRLGGYTSAEEFGNVIYSTIVIGLFYLVILSVFSGPLKLKGIPFVAQLSTEKGLSELFKSSFGVFVLECLKLISLSFFMSFLSSLIPSSFGGQGITGKFLRSILLVLIGVLCNHFFISYAEDTPVFSWAASALQCFIGGTNLVLTPCMMIGQLLKLSPDHPVVSYLTEKLPQTKIGRAISTSTTNSLTFVFCLMLFESQCGSIGSVIGSLPSIIGMFAPSVIALIGISMIVRAIKKR